MNMVDTRALSSTPLLQSHELVVGILRHQRQERLQALWKSNKRQLWRKLNRPEEIDSPLLIVLPEPEMDTKDDIRVQMRRLEGLVERAQADFKTSTEEIQLQLQFESKRQELRTLMQLAEVQAKSRPTDVWEQIERSESLFDDLRNLRPADMGLVNEYVNQCYRVSEVLHQQNELSAAERLSGHIVDLLRRVVSQQPDDVAVKRQYSVALDSAGRVCESLEKWREAESLFRESLQVSRDLLAKSPGNAQAARDVSISLNKCGDVCVQRELWLEAESLFRESLQISRDLLGKSPGNAQAARDVSVALERLGTVAARSDHPRDAIPYIQEAEAAYSAVLVAAIPGNIEPCADVIDLRLQFISLLLRLRRVSVARSLMQQETSQQSIDVLRQQGSSTRHHVLVALWDFFEAKLTTNVKKRTELIHRSSDVLDRPEASRLLRVTTGFYLINRDYLEHKKCLLRSPGTRRKRKK
jgi:tetratricopeptide (TPR) repeat protein